MSTSVTLIHNPGAGDDSGASGRAIENLLRKAGYAVRYQSSGLPGWTRALKRSADFVAVAGGDGTVAEVARRLIHSAVPIAVLPAGTANNISKTLGIAEHSLERLVSTWKHARVIAFDAGLATGPWGDRHFIEGCGAGLLTRHFPRANASRALEKIRTAEVKVNYAQSLFAEQILNTPSMDIEASLDGRDISGRYLLMEAMNMQYIGPNLLLAPCASNGSGEFDVVMVPEGDRSLLYQHVRHWQEGRTPPPAFRTRRGRRLQIRWNGFSIHIDDRVWPSRGRKRPPQPAAIELRVIPSAVRFLVPDEAHDGKRASATARSARKFGSGIAELPAAAALISGSLQCDF